MKKATAVRPHPESWEAKMERRVEFTARFVAEHHPGMADAHKIKGAHPLIPLGGPRISIGGLRPDWWFQTDDSMAALGFVYINHLFQRHGMRDHGWMIGRSDQEPWALISEPYSLVTAMPALRRDLERVGVELLEYPTEQSTHNPGQTLMLVANVKSMHCLMGQVARLIVAECPPPRTDEDED
jgi:hypothetical protein